MKIIIDQNELKKALTICSAAVGKINLASPIDGVLFSASSNELKLTTYDYDTAIICKTKCSIVEPGEALISYKLLSGIISKCLGEVTIETDIANVIIKNDAAEYKLPLQSVELFPELPALPKDTETVAIPSNIFYNGVRKIERFISSDSESVTMHPLIATTQIKIQDGVITFVATDRYRLAKYTASIESTNNFEIYLNKKVIKNCLDIEDENIIVSKGARHSIIQIADVTIVTRTYAGDYIDYAPIFAAPIDYSGKISTKIFRNAVTAISPIVTNNKLVPLKMIFTEPGEILLSMSTSLGCSKITCALKENMSNTQGVNFEETTGIDIQYLLDALSVCTDDDITIKQQSATSPFVIEEQDTKYILMPMRLK